MNTINIYSNNLAKHRKETEKYLNILKIDNIYLDLKVCEMPNKNDTYKIKFQNNKGEISGNTPFALLSGIYAFFEKCGVRFLFPGSKGEFIPENVQVPDIDITSEASFYHRGVCIEGAVSKKHVINMIDWQAKVGMNTYFTQFRQSWTFFDRWYSHITNPYSSKTEITIGQADDFIKDIIKEIKSRGMIYQAVGHGWTCEPFGYNALGWDKVKYEPKNEDRVHLALVNGKRDFWNHQPINTNLCYSNADTRKIIINDIINYLKDIPDVDILHLWLADDFNNHCECEECTKMRPADYYVMLLNELDEALTKENIDTKIVFLVYYELLWKPEHNIIKNQDRFIIMFAPITRTYLESFENVQNPKEPGEFTRNNIKNPRTDEEFVGLFNSWREDFKGDSFNFDYYLMWQYVKDPSFINTAKLINKDIKCYDRLTLNGLISCQIQRIFMPTNLPMYVMAKTLWNQNLTFEEIEEDYYSHAFGKDYKIALEYSHKIAEYFNPKYLIPKIDKSEEAATSFRECIAFISLASQYLEDLHFNNTLNTNLYFTWEMLYQYCKLTKVFAKTILSYIKENKEQFDIHYSALREVKNEMDIYYNEYFDGWGFTNVVREMFKDYLNL